MAYTLSDILQQIYRDFGQTEEFQATGGSATTCVNSFWGDLENPPEETRFKGSYLFVVRDAGGAGASPEGRWARISAYNTETWTLTHESVTDAIVSGDWCMFASTKTFPLFDSISQINRGLKELGYLPTPDTSLTSASNQTEYTIPSSLQGRKMYEVWVQGQTTDSNDNQWTPINGWKQLSDTLIYIPQLDSGYTIKLGGWSLHAPLTSYNSTLNVNIPLTLAVTAGKVAILEQYIAKNADDTEKSWRAMYDESLRQREEYKKELGIYLPRERKNSVMFGPISFGE